MAKQATTKGLQEFRIVLGMELIFKTSRVGFPNANVVAVENASIQEPRRNAIVL